MEMKSLNLQIEKESASRVTAYVDVSFKNLRFYTSQIIGLE